MQVYMAVTDSIHYLIAKKHWFWGSDTEGELFLHNAGQWVFPGGRRNDGEEIIAGAKREFREETGVDLDTYTIISTTFFGNPYRLVICRVSNANLLAIHAAAHAILTGADKPDGLHRELRDVQLVTKAETTHYLGVRVANPEGPAFTAFVPTDGNQAIDWYAAMAHYVSTH